MKEFVFVYTNIFLHTMSNFGMTQEQIDYALYLFRVIRNERTWADVVTYGSPNPMVDTDDENDAYENDAYENVDYDSDIEEDWPTEPWEEEIPDNEW